MGNAPSVIVLASFVLRQKQSLCRFVRQCVQILRVDAVDMGFVCMLWCLPTSRYILFGCSTLYKINIYLSSCVPCLYACVYSVSFIPKLSPLVVAMTFQLWKIRKGRAWSWKLCNPGLDAIRRSCTCTRMQFSKSFKLPEDQALAILKFAKVKGHLMK